MQYFSGIDFPCWLIGDWWVTCIKLKYAEHYGNLKKWIKSGTGFITGGTGHNPRN